MATIQSRPFSKDYSGLINQSVVAGCIVVLCVTAHEWMKRKRRMTDRGQDRNSVESWEFGYLYQSRSWAKRPSPHPKGWPLHWINQVLTVSEERMNELRGTDATLYTRFLRGCFWFTLSQVCTTLPILLPIHVIFSDGSVSPRSMTRASISSLISTQKGMSLLWIHLLLLVWITLCWISVLVWMCRGAFHIRAQNILAAADQVAARGQERATKDFAHPHSRFSFYAYPQNDNDKSNRGIRLRTVMVTNVPPPLRSEKDLKEYFEYYLSRGVAKPVLGITRTTQPGFSNKSFTFLLNRLMHIPTRFRHPSLPSCSPQVTAMKEVDPLTDAKRDGLNAPIDRVVLVRKMADLALLLERREEILRLLETAHIKLARRTLTAVKQAMNHTTDNFSERLTAAPVRADPIVGTEEGIATCEDRMQLLARALGPYIAISDGAVTELSSRRSHHGSFAPSEIRSLPPTVWDALLGLPRSTLDAYQPLIHLSALFHGRTVPSIDYYTAKLDILTSLITEKRAKPSNEYEPMSTAFVTFADPTDARRACKFLTVHPANPLQCLVTMAPSYEDLDWIRLMKPTFRVEFVKDWLVNLGVWGFTVSWIFPVSILVGLVSIQNFSSFWPGLRTYLDKHPWEEELLQSFIPTLLVSLLSLLIPLILLLIAKKAHTIATLSALHDKIMTRYYKFLIVNVLVFFCVGTAALQSFLVSITSTSGLKVIQIVADSFPTAGPFYVGWLIFTTAMHGGLELALLGLPLILYPATKRQVTPRKRAVGIRPRTFNYYYWLPNHLLIVHIVLVFALLNPLVIPFSFVYFCVEATVIKNQLLQVYAKNYEGNGQVILIRLIRYSLDGLLLAQVVFLAYMVVLKKTVNIAVSALLVILTIGTKLLLTWLCRARFERDDLLEAQIVCGTGCTTEALEAVQLMKNDSIDAEQDPPKETEQQNISQTLPPAMKTWRFPDRIDDGYATIPRRPQHRTRRQPIPFGLAHSELSEKVLQSAALDTGVSTTLPSLGRTEADCNDHYLHVEPAQTSESSAVTRRPPHPAWDDESSPDHPYDNPYYSQAIRDKLWLPCDPLAPVNLDDTVDVRFSLTTLPGSGKLGAWREDEFLASSLSSVLAGHGRTSHPGDGSNRSLPAPRWLNGNEQIDLPFDIATRVQSIGRELDVEMAMSTRRRWNYSDGITSIELGLGHPSGRTSSTAGMRPSSLGPEVYRHRLPSSFLTFYRHHGGNRSVSTGHGPDLRGRSHAAVSGPHPPVRSTVMTRYPPLAPTTAGGTRVVSLREAVVEEAIVEEEVVQEFLRGEEADEGRREEPRSWLTSWIFAKWQ